MRPLIAMDKAEEIGTFETSIQPYEDCCTVFLPKHSATKPKLERILESESYIDVEGLIAAAVESEEIVYITNKQGNQDSLSKSRSQGNMKNIQYSVAICNFCDSIYL